MHTHERALEHYDSRRQTVKKVLVALRPDLHGEPEWHHAVKDFVSVNFAEIEARVIAHHLANGDTIPIELDHPLTGRVSSPEFQNIKPIKSGEDHHAQRDG